MNRELKLALLAFVTIAATGCLEPTHLTHDYGRAFTDSFAGQSDLSRSAASQAAYGLTGTEAVKIRLAVENATTDAASEQSTLTSASN